MNGFCVTTKLEIGMREYTIFNLGNIYHFIKDVYVISLYTSSWQ